MDAASVVDLTRLSTCAPVLREMMQLSVVRDSVGRCVDASNRLNLAQQAMQDLANQLNVVRGELALERRARGDPYPEFQD